ncbi:phage tail tip lysozyme [Paraburkholderia sp. A2RI-6]|uniref:phage tail tip lysozyme n=1 Tax=Paraburkholderia sp. A2RI-6 TaxID=3028371 RepID=UPI003B76FF73
MQKRVGALGAAGNSNLAKLEGGFRRAATAAGKVVDKIVEIVPGLTAIGGAASLAGLSALAVRFGSFGFTLNKTSKLLGMNAQDLSAWHVAARRAGVSAEEFDSSMNASQMAIRGAANGADPHAMLLLQKMGVQIARNKDGTVDYYSTQMRLMKAIQGQRSVQAQREAANTFGMGGVLPMIQEGTWDADKARAYKAGLVPTDAEIAQAKAFNEDISDLRASTEGLANTIGSALIPVLDPVVKAVSRWLNDNRAQIADKISGAVQRFVDWVSKINWDAVASKASAFYDAIGGIKGVAIALAAITFASPISGVLSLIGALTRLTSVTIPGAVGALARLASAPLLAGILALLHSENLNTGESDYLAGRQSDTWDGDPVGQRRAAANAKNAPIGDRQRYLFERFKGAGYTDAQAAGQIGSLMQENSTLDPAAVNPKSGAAGFGQWLGPRARQFEKMFGHSVQQGTFGEQTDFYLWEMQHTERQADQRIRMAKTPEQAAEIQAREYERPGAAEANIANRQAYAERVYASLAGKTSPGSAPDSDRRGAVAPDTVQSAGAEAGIANRQAYAERVYASSPDKPSPSSTPDSNLGGPVAPDGDQAESAEANVARRQAYVDRVYASLAGRPSPGSAPDSDRRGPVTPDTAQAAGAEARDARVAQTQQNTLHVTFDNVPPGVRPEAKAQDGSYLPTKVNYRLDGI